MVNTSSSTCPMCGEPLEYLDRVNRIVRSKGGEVRKDKIRRMYCGRCGVTHREIPEYLLPYKHYEAKIIEGVINGTITSFDLEYEDYPCEMTMKRWKASHDKHLF